MHEIDQTTEHMVRSVLAYAENRLRWIRCHSTPAPSRRRSSTHGWPA